MTTSKIIAISAALFALPLQSGKTFAQNDTDNDFCPKCEIEKAVNYQFNALRLGEIELPQNIKGKNISYRYEPNKEMSGTKLFGNKLIVSRLPKGTPQKGGSLICTVDGKDFVIPLTIAADDEMYGYLYCHMAGNSENTLYALGTKEDNGEIYHPLLDNQPIYDAEKIALIEKGVRDAFIYRSHDGGYIMLTTDMCMAKKPGPNAPWHNYGMDLLKSNDLIHWTSTTFDFRKGPKIFSDPNSKDVFEDWTKIIRVWAPQVIWDANYDNGKGGYFIYYSMLSQNQGDTYDKIYYSYANRDFTKMTKPQVFYDKGISVIDCHIDWNDCDQKYHVFYKKEGAAGVDRGVWAATFDRLGSGDWHDTFHVTNEGKEQVEGPSAFRLINENTWKVAYIRYSGGHAYRICTANPQCEEVGTGVTIRENVNPQHGSFMQVTKAEYQLLETWSKLKLKVQELEKNGEKSKEVQNAKKALEKTFNSDAIAQLQKLYDKTLETLK